MSYPPNQGYGYPPAGGPPPSSGPPPPPGQNWGAGQQQYPPPPGAPGGYPSPVAGGYPPQPAPPATGGAYPPPPAGYPGGGMPAAAPAPYGGGPPQGYPQATPAPYPGQPPAAGYPAAPQATPPYPGQPPAAGYGAAPAGYPQQPGYGAAPQATPPYPGQPPAAGYGAAPQATPPYPGQPPAAGYGAAPAGYPHQPQAAPYPYAQQQQQPPAAAAAAPAAAYSAPPPSQLYGSAPGTSGDKIKGVAPPPMNPPLSKQMENLQLKDQPFETHGTIKPASPFDSERDAEILRKAMKGMGTDETAIIEVISKRSNKQRQEIKLCFKTMYGKDLIKDLKSELGGDLKSLVEALFMPSDYFDAWSINYAIKGLGTDEEILIEILCSRTNEEIKAITAMYKTMYHKSLEEDCIGDTSGHFKRLLVSMCQGNRDVGNTVDMAKARKEADELYKAGEGKWGTDESAFNKVLAKRNFAQLRATFKEYTKIAQRDILSSIDREFSGSVKSGMKAIVNCVRSRPAYFAERLYRAMKGAGTDDETLVRAIVTRSEIDLVEIKKSFLEKYQKTLSKMVKSETSGDYRKLLCAIIGSEEY